MKANKKTMFAAALAVAIVALAGVGYAAVAGNFTAVTTNGGNTVADAYILATQTSSDGEAPDPYTAQFSGTVKLDTYTSSATPVYVLQGANTLMESGHYGVQVGTNTVTVNLTATNTNVATFNMSAKISELNSAWEYYLMVGGTPYKVGNGGVVTGISPITATDNAATVTVQLFIAGPDFDNLETGYTGYADKGYSNTFGGGASIFTSAKVFMEFTATGTA